MGPFSFGEKHKGGDEQLTTWYCMRNRKGMELKTDSKTKANMMSFLGWKITNIYSYELVKRPKELRM